MKFDFKATHPSRAEWPYALLVLAGFRQAGGVMGALGAYAAKQVNRHDAPTTVWGVDLSS